MRASDGVEREQGQAPVLDHHLDVDATGSAIAADVARAAAVGAMVPGRPIAQTRAPAPLQMHLQMRGGGGGGGGNSSVFLYYFAHTPSYSANYPDLPTLGAFHGAEVPFAFGAQFELKTDAERALSAVMRCYWRNFAHTGDPNAGPCISPPQPWPRFLPGPAEATMVLDLGEALKPEQRLKATQCQAFAKTKGWGGGGGGEAY